MLKFLPLPRDYNHCSGSLWLTHRDDWRVESSESSHNQPPLSGARRHTPIEDVFTFLVFIDKEQHRVPNHRGLTDDGADWRFQVRVNTERNIGPVVEMCHALRENQDWSRRT